MLEWIVDCGWTPHLIVDATSESVHVPRQFVKEGRIVLNISASATQAFRIGNDAVEFNARFSGVGHHIVVPCEHVLGIYARETGQGMVFTDEPGGAAASEGGAPGTTTAPSDDGGDDEPPPTSPEPPKKRPSLKVVK